MESCSSLHFDRSMRVVSEHEDRVMKGGLLSPPAGPLAIAPGSTYRPEHVPTHDGGAHTRSPLREVLVIDPRVAAVIADHLPSAAGGEDPFVELHAPETERMVEILVGPSGVPVERDREVSNEQSGHLLPPSVRSHHCWTRHSPTANLVSYDPAVTVPDRRVGGMLRLCQQGSSVLTTVSRSNVSTMDRSTWWGCNKRMHPCPNAGPGVGLDVRQGRPSLRRRARST